MDEDFSNQFPKVSALIDGLTSVFEQPEMPSLGSTMGDVYSSLLQYGPQLAAMDWSNQSTYIPQQIALATRLAGRYLPQQSQIALNNMSQFAPQYQNLVQGLIENSRDSDMAQALGYVPALQALQQQVEGPTATAMRSLLGSQILGDLQMGTQLTPADVRQVEQGLRSSEAARGISSGSASANREAVAKALQGRSLQQQRQNQAFNYLSQNKQAQYDPFETILNRNTPSATAAMTLAGQPMQTPTAIGTTPDVLNAGMNLAGMGQSAQQLGYGAAQDALGTQLALTNLALSYA